MSVYNDRDWDRHCDREVEQAVECSCDRYRHGIRYWVGIGMVLWSGSRLDFFCLELVLFLLFIRIKNKFFLNMCMNLFYCKIVFDFANFYTMQ